ncbi:MAG: hypothetical protein GXY38_13880 [Planctomycetes bacterium]|nr:hypothetical protein [Planctomycetota bacterium]
MKRYLMAGVGITAVVLMLAQAAPAQNQKQDEWKQEVDVGSQRQTGGAAGATAGQQTTVTGTIVGLREYLMHGQAATSQYRQQQQQQQLGRERISNAMVLILDPGQSLTGGATGAQGTSEWQRQQQQQRSGQTSGQQDDQAIRPLDRLGGQTGAGGQSQSGQQGSTGSGQSSGRTGGMTTGGTQSSGQSGGQSSGQTSGQTSGTTSGGQTGAGTYRSQSSGSQGGMTGAGEGNAVLLFPSQDSPQALSQAQDWMGQRVRVTGKVWTRNNMNAIAVERIERIESRQ